MKDKLRIGVLGAGRIGKIHAQNIHSYIPQAQLVAIADPYADEKTKAWAKGLGVEILPDSEAVINDPSIDAVVICTSTDTHSALAVKAVAAGKHIFCEKPVDVTKQKVSAAIQAAKEAGVNFQVGFNRRFDHNHMAVREAVKSGAVGDVNVIKITSRDPLPPPVSYIKVSGGIFLDMMIHDFDMARFQAGSPVVEVYAMGAVLVDPQIKDAGDIDTAIVTLKFENGAIGVIDNCRRASYGYDQRVEVFGSKGSAEDFNDTTSSVRLSNADGIHSEKPLNFFLERYQQSYVDEMRSFVECTLNSKPLVVDANDGLEDLLVAQAAALSLKENRPVKISEVR